MVRGLNPRTLAFQMGVRPGLQHRDISTATLSEVARNLRLWMNEKPFMVCGPIMEAPECDALKFYMMNHALADLSSRRDPREELPKAELEFMNAFHVQLSWMATRMFFYMLLICTRESRHAHVSPTHPVMEKMAQKFGNSVCKFHETIRGKGSSSAAEALMKSPPAGISLGNYTHFLTRMFYECDYSSGYGGHAWGKVADALHGFVIGKLTAEMMLDTAFTLCHNNGPIFNKGMLYHSYGSEIYKILDVQRSGQIPTLVKTDGVSAAKYAPVKDLMGLCQAAAPGIFEEYVDWYLVEELGALKSYEQEKSNQVMLYGTSKKTKAYKEAQQLKAAHKAKKDQGLALAGELEAPAITKSVEIMPGVFVDTVEKAR